MGKPQIIINKIMTIGIVLLIEQIGLIQIENMGLMIIIFIKDCVLIEFHQKKFLLKIIIFMNGNNNRYKRISREKSNIIKYYNETN